MIPETHTERELGGHEASDRVNVMIPQRERELGVKMKHRRTELIL